jgi:thiamine-phosphate pyrophosphorylase
MLVTDRRMVGGDAPLVTRIEAALAACPPGAVVVQVREKDLDEAGLCRLGARLVAVAHAAGDRIVLNGEPALAARLGFDGVHRPDAELPLDPGAGTAALSQARAAVGARGLVGTSAHSLARVELAARAGVDAVVFGPIWATPQKARYGAPLGLGALAAAAAVIGPSRARLVAIGGIDGPERAAQARAAGAHAVAVIRAVLTAADPGAAAAALVTAS